MSDKIVHEYDGIEEQDNHLPNWWLVILFGTIAFGLGYWFVFHTVKQVPTHEDLYRAEIEAIKRSHHAENPEAEVPVAELVKDPAMVEEGRKVFASTCASCHAAEGQGLVGPNLTDRYWIHGNSAEALVKGVTEGFPEKGMPGWGPMLGPAKVRQVVAFVMTLEGKNLAGKEPQGDLVE